MQFNALYGDSGHPRRIRRDFLEFSGNAPETHAEEEVILNDHFNWEVGGDYEYSFANNHRLQMLFVASEQTRDDVRERFAVDAIGVAGSNSEKNLYIESNQRTRARIVQGNYSFPLGSDQDLRLGLESADTQLASSLFIGSSSGSAPGSERYGGLPPRPIILIGNKTQTLATPGSNRNRRLAMSSVLNIGYSMTTAC